MSLKNIFIASVRPILELNCVTWCPNSRVRIDNIGKGVSLD